MGFLILYHVKKLTFPYKADLTQSLKIGDKRMMQNKTGLFLLVAAAAFVSGLALGIYSQRILSEKKALPLSSALSETKSPLDEEFDEELDDEENLKLDMEEDPPDASEKEEESIERYKEMLKKTVESELSKKSKKGYTSWGVVVGSYTNQDQANEKAIDLHLRYKKWKITTQETNNTYKVVIGPFENEKEAKAFLNTLPKRSEFLGAQVISFHWP